MTVLDLQALQSSQDSGDIEKHFLAAAYNHLCFGFGDNQWIDDFILLPNRNDLFTDPFNRYMYECLKDEYLSFSRTPTNDVTLATRLKNIAGCDMKTAEEYIDQVSVCAVEKDIQVWKNEIMPIWYLHCSRASIKDSLKRSLDIVDKGCSPKEAQGALSLVLGAANLLEGADAYEERIHPLEQAREKLLGPRIENRVVRTRFSGLNTALNGGLNHYKNGSGGRFMVNCGRPGSGKSTWAMNLALDVAMSDCKVLFYSLEMSGEEVAQRMLSCLDYLTCLQLGGEPVTYSAVLRQDLNREQRARMTSLSFEKITNNLIFVDAYNVTPSQVVTRIKAEKIRNKNLTLVIIDYLTLMDIDSDSGGKDSRALMVGNATRKLKLASLSTGIDILAVCQLNRAVEGRTDKRPTSSDLRESGRIEEDADLIIGNYWPYYYNKNEDQMLYEYIIIKNRRGPMGTCNILFAAENYAMTDKPVNF